MKRPAMILFVVVAGLSMGLRGWGADTAPATQPQFAEGSAKDALKKLNDALPAGGLTAARDAYLAANDEDKRAADAMSKNDLVTAQLQSKAVELFGPQAEDLFLRAARNSTLTDLMKAEEKTTDDTSTITFPHKLGIVVMAKGDGHWKVDVAKSLKANNVSSDDVVAQCEAMGKVFDAVSKDLKDGQLPNQELFLRDIKQRMFRIAGEEPQ